MVMSSTSPKFPHHHPGRLGTFWGPLWRRGAHPPQEYTRAYLTHLGSGVDLIIFNHHHLTMIKQPMGIAGIIRGFTAHGGKLPPREAMCDGPA